MAAMMEQLRCELGCDCLPGSFKAYGLVEGTLSYWAVCAERTGVLVLLPTGTGCGVLVPARTTAVATTLELQLQRYVLKCWQSVASDCARNCNYNAGRGQFTSVQVHMRQLNLNTLELKYYLGLHITTGMEIFTVGNFRDCAIQCIRE